jgi:predicted lipoprotein with Yx(FWY)xxD motif
MSVLGIESRSIRFLGFSAATALLVMACGGSSGGSPTAPAPTVGPSAAASPASSGGAGNLTIATGTTNAAGTVLTGKDGLTLYIFKRDTSPNTSACTGDCAGTWPPLTVAAGQTPTAGSGVTGTLATFARTDGTTQVSYGGAALYYYSGDSAAGDANGQGKGNIWFAATPSGTSGGSPAPSSAASPAASGGGTVYTVDLASGGYLTGEDGKSLYVFKKDSQMTSACTSANCTTNWPPFTVDTGESAAAGGGVSGTIATFARPDGGTQVTYNGQPLYYFVGDSKAGDTTGASVSPDWSLAKPKARPGY